jgi:hypothetical protein
MMDAAPLASTYADETKAGDETPIRVRLDQLVSDLDGSGDLERLEDALHEFNILALGPST